MLINHLTSEFGPKSRHGRTHSLRMICNGYAFRIGLVKYCAELLSYFGQKDLVALDHPSADWSHAATLLIDALTWDCNEHDSFYGYYPGWGFDTPCFPETFQSHIADIESILDKFRTVGESPETMLLLAYLSLDKGSVQHFMGALNADDELAVIYAARLAKRLLRRGMIDAASSIVLSIQPHKKERLKREEQLLLEWTTKSVIEDRTYSNWHEQLIGVF